MKQKVLKTVSITFLALLLLGSLSSCNKQDKKAGVKLGMLSYLNTSEEEIISMLEGTKGATHYLQNLGYATIGRHAHENMNKGVPPTIIYYDTVDAMIMALDSKEIKAMIGIPQTTANYICAKNPILGSEIHYNWRKPREKNSLPDLLFQSLETGFAFMMLEKNVALRDQFNQVIQEMEADGSLHKMIDDIIIDSMDGAELKVVQSENKEGRETIKVAVTGSLPPLDYVDSDGSFAGFNTALLSEIGKRLNKNISLVQVTSIGRATALASGNVDVVFWTRSSVPGPLSTMTIKEAEEILLNEKSEREDLNQIANGIRENLKRYEKINIREIVEKRDMPEGTVITIPYFADTPVTIARKR